MTFAVFKILFSNVYSLGEFFGNFKKGPKGIIKNLLIILLALYCFVVFVGLFGLTMTSIYTGLEGSGKTALMPGYGLVLALMITLFFGLVSVATNYYTGAGEDQLFSMPLKPKEIFGAKFALSVVSDALFGSLILVICAIIFGVKEGTYTNPLFYIGVIVSIVTVSIVSVFVLYLVFVLLLTLIPALRKRTVMQGIATTIVICFSACCGFLGQMGGNMMAGNPSYDDVDPGFALVNSGIGRLCETKVVSLFANCLVGDILSILIMLAVGALIVFVCVPAISTLYINSLIGFSDVKTKKMNQTQVNKVLKESGKTKSIFNALYWRDIKCVLGEPAFFANGPLMVFLMPVIMLIPALFSIANIDGVGLGGLSSDIYNFFVYGEVASIQKANYYIALIFAAFTIFTGNSSSIASTSFSREGKGLGNLKAMPIEADTIILSKFAHAFTYCVIANVMFIVILSAAIVFLGISSVLTILVKDMLFGTMLSLVVSLFLVFVEMFLDTANPKLNWENPMAAFKQNVNSVISIFATMAVVAIFVLVGIFALPKNMIGFIVLIAVFGVLAAPTGYLYFKYSTKRFADL